MTAPQIDFRVFRDAKAEQRPRTVRPIGGALRTSGFFYLTHTGIAPERVRRMLEASRAFFGLPEARKIERRWTGKVGVMGYVPREREALDESRPPDLKEAFNVTPPVGDRDPAALATIWAGEQDPLRIEAEEFAARCFELAQEILAAIALALDLPEGFFAERHRPATQGMRLFHYFPAAEGRAPRQLGCGDHSDHGTVSLLFQDDAGGLEFLDADGEWQPLPPVEGAVVVNAGDMLARWTGGVVRSAPHHVLTGAGHRFSLGYFLVAGDDVVLSCPRTAVLPGTAEAPTPLTAHDFLLLRSLRRAERFFRTRGASVAAGAAPPALVDMRKRVAQRMGLDEAGLDRRLAELGQVDTRDAVGV